MTDNRGILAPPMDRRRTHTRLIRGRHYVRLGGKTVDSDDHTEQIDWRCNPPTVGVYPMRQQPIGSSLVRSCQPHPTSALARGESGAIDKGPIAKPTRVHPLIPGTPWAG